MTSSLLTTSLTGSGHFGVSGSFGSTGLSGVGVGLSGSIGSIRSRSVTVNSWSTDASKSKFLFDALVKPSLTNS